MSQVEQIADEQLYFPTTTLSKCFKACDVGFYLQLKLIIIFQSYFFDFLQGRDHITQTTKSRNCDRILDWNMLQLRSLLLFLLFGATLGTIQGLLLLYAQRLLLEGLGGLYMVQEIKLGLAACQVRSLPAEAPHLINIFKYVKVITRKFRA